MSDSDQEYLYRNIPRTKTKQRRVKARYVTSDSEDGYVYSSDEHSPVFNSNFDRFMAPQTHTNAVYNAGYSKVTSDQPVQNELSSSSAENSPVTEQTSELSTETLPPVNTTSPQSIPADQSKSNGNDVGNTGGDKSPNPVEPECTTESVNTSVKREKS